MIKLFTNNNGLSVLLSLVVITMPLKSNINSMAMILFFVYSICFLYAKRTEIMLKPSKEVLVLVLPFVFLLLQGVYSEWDSFSVNILRSIPLVLFPFFFFYLKPDEKQIKVVFSVLVGSATLYTLFLFVFALFRQVNYMPDFSAINWYFFTYYDYTEVLGIHPTYLGMYLCLAFAVLFFKFLNGSKKRIRNVTLLSFLGFNIFLSGSRISLVCLVLIILLLLMFKLKELNTNMKIGVLFFLVMFPFLVFNFVPIVKERMIDMTFGLKNNYQYAKYGDRGKDNNYNGGLAPRFKIWSCAIDVGKQNYYFGSGFGTTQVKLNTCYLNNNLEAFADKNYQTHSQYFNNFARGGFLGLFSLLLLYFYSLIFAIKRKQILHLCLIIIIIIVSSTENILNRHLGVVFFTFFNSLFFFSKNHQNNER